MNAQQIRQTFLNFFESHRHHLVASAPMVIKNDPTLMFTNAGMNQFKDIFLGNSPVKYPRIANSQKCLRVSGKHNDLEEVGHDTYHHTMFEMLGNWSFGDYFKKEAIEWGWELLTDVYKIDKDRLYVTVFGGDTDDNLPADTEAFNYWKSWIAEDRILLGNKKDNFWEMGDTGPCGPCSEIHVDLRDEAERQLTPGAQLVNEGHPLVIEIWNLVFMEFNRLANGKLQPLPAKHVDTGMGFERLCMALQNKKSNYDTDVFQPIIKTIASLSSIEYGTSSETDVAMRVIADHLRAISFAIADGQLPSNNKAGYVIRRILRRAVRYGYTFLGLHEPFIHKLVPVLVDEMGGYFTELKSQQTLIEKVIAEEENGFLRTLANGIHKFNHYIESNPETSQIDGDFAFELFDTYGFPVDLTALMAREHHKTIDMDGFYRGLEAQKARSRKDAAIELDDWVVVNAGLPEVFVGYDTLFADTYITRYRKINNKGKTFFQIVLAETPFYAESGGQVGDKGTLKSEAENIEVLDTLKENNLTIHLTAKLPDDISAGLRAYVSAGARQNTANNHSATHLLHHALRQIMGNHVEQKGSYVHPDYLRFDFSHFQKLSEEELSAIEHRVNAMIRENHTLNEHRDIPVEDALKRGALALFGEKYGDIVRTISFGPSIELCGGTHVKATGQIGYFKIISESAIAAGVRRIEAITGEGAEKFLNQQLNILTQVKEMTKNPADVLKGVKSLVDENHKLRQQAEALLDEKIKSISNELIQQAIPKEDYRLITSQINMEPDAVKNLAFKIKNAGNDFLIVLASLHEGKPGIVVALSDELASAGKYSAAAIIKTLSREIKGGGGGQPHIATAGGSFVEGLEQVIQKARSGSF
ncbi:MAG: alanine--tRNA ligase [Lentimicrobiaceae bacterium]|nr:alanine--tRNA ligase [Lentimicrobiaceae bacterium]